jgi:DNA-binding LytR/AlgR family response regulator
MTNVAILEDEGLARRALEAAVHRVAPAAVIVAALESVAAGLRWFQTHEPPDLLLADIQLGDGLSFELFEQIELRCQVVFCTAHDEYAISAMAAGGIGYLRKPIADHDLARALARYQRLEAHFAERVRALGRVLLAPRRILGRRRGAFVALSLDQLAYFVVDDKQTEAVAVNGQRYAIDQTLSELETMLDPTRYFRVNRQYLASASAIEGFRPFIKGKLLVTLTPAPSREVVVSQENAARFRDWLCG